MTPTHTQPDPGVRRLIRQGLLVIALAFGGIGGWAALAPLDGAIIAPGLLKVQGTRKTVQHLEGGLVRQIHVRDGDRVQAGDPLVTLGDERVAASLDLLVQQLDAEKARVARLLAQRDFADRVEFPADLLQRAGTPRVAQLLQRERALFTAMRGALLQQMALSSVQIGQTREELAGVQVQSDADDSAARMMQEEVQTYETLLQQNYIAGAAVLRLRRNHEEYQVRRGERQAAAAQARQRITELELAQATRRNDYLKDASDQLVNASARLGELQERHRAVLDQVARQSVLAPIAGTVVGLRVFTLGGVVRPGEPLLDIVPSDEGLIVEAQVNLDDVDQVHPGQAAQVRLSAFNARSTPLLDGQLVYLSADKLDSERGDRSFYVVHVALPADARQLLGPLLMQPGMRAEVFLKTPPRTALQYLLEPITVSLRRAAREP
jgi:HlyD family type I secretion membrane fusion protein